MKAIQGEVFQLKAGSKTSYKEIDEAILAAIDNGCEDFYSIHMSDRVRTLAGTLAKPDRWGRAEPFRVTDRRLQVLRKSGRIVFVSRKWQAVRP